MQSETAAPVRGGFLSDYTKRFEAGSVSAEP